MSGRRLHPTAHTYSTTAVEPLNVLQPSHPVFTEIQNNVGYLSAEFVDVRYVDETTCFLRLKITSHPEPRWRFCSTRLVWKFNEATPYKKAYGSVPLAKAKGLSNIRPRILGLAPECSYWSTTSESKSRVVTLGGAIPVTAPGVTVSLPVGTVQDTANKTVTYAVRIFGTSRGKPARHECVWTVQENKSIKTGLPLEYHIGVLVEHHGPFATSLVIESELRRHLWPWRSILSSQRDAFRADTTLIHIEKSTAWGDEENSQLANELAIRAGRAKDTSGLSKDDGEEKAVIKSPSEKGSTSSASSPRETHVHLHLHVHSQNGASLQATSGLPLISHAPSSSGRKMLKAGNPSTGASSDSPEDLERPNFSIHNEPMLSEASLNSAVKQSSPSHTVKPRSKQSPPVSGHQEPLLDPYSNIPRGPPNKRLLLASVNDFDDETHRNPMPRAHTRPAPPDSPRRRVAPTAPSPPRIRQPIPIPISDNRVLLTSVNGYNDGINARVLPQASPPLPRSPVPTRCPSPPSPRIPVPVYDNDRFLASINGYNNGINERALPRAAMPRMVSPPSSLHVDPHPPQTVYTVPHPRTPPSPWYPSGPPSPRFPNPPPPPIEVVRSPSITPSVLPKPQNRRMLLNSVSEYNWNAHSDPMPAAERRAPPSPPSPPHTASSRSSSMGSRKAA